MNSTAGPWEEVFLLLRMGRSNLEFTHASETKNQIQILSDAEKSWSLDKAPQTWGGGQVF